MGFALCSWDSIRSQKESNPEFEKMWTQACDTFEQLSAKKPPTFNPEAFGNSDVQGYRVEMACDFLEDAEVQTTYSVSLSELQQHGVVIDKIKDERGVERQGLLLPSGKRRVHLFATHSTDYTERIHNEALQLRGSQGAELMACYRCDLAKVCPLGQKNGKGTLASDVALVGEKITEAKKVEAEKAKLLAATASQQSAQVSTSQQVAADPGQESDMSEVFELQGPSSKQKGKKGADRKLQEKQRRSKGKVAKKDSKLRIGSPRKQQLRATRSSACTSIADETCSQGSAGPPSLAGTKVSEGNASQKTPLETYKFHTNALSVEKLLAGEKLGVAKFQAERAVQNLGRSPEGAVRKVLLQSHVDVFKDAQAILPSVVHKVPKARRDAILTNLATYGISIPPFTRGGLLGQSLAEEKCLISKAKLLDPPQVHHTEAFDPHRPVLATTGLESAEIGKLLQKCLVLEGVVPSLCEGKVQRPTSWIAASMCTRLGAPCSTRQTSPCSAPMLLVLFLKLWM